jgi:coproporphyrinogen III oxidase-like Fe-S oxidoreductase
MGVQDFNKEVQRLVNREQDEEFISALKLKWPRSRFIKRLICALLR